MPIGRRLCKSLCSETSSLLLLPLSLLFLLFLPLLSLLLFLPQLSVPDVTPAHSVQTSSGCACSRREAAHSVESPTGRHHRFASSTVMTANSHTSKTIRRRGPKWRICVNTEDASIPPMFASRASVIPAVSRARCCFAVTGLKPVCAVEVSSVAGGTHVFDVTFRRT